ncbi:MAG: HNH endonuclease [Rhodospirillales bacterium]|nr:HNH endonuclease [Rhodospirillales bacterium]MYE18433.1 HNH endonuclease [Rhodospirillales bacterium]
MTPAHRKRIFEAHDGICGYCEKPIDGPFEVDHLLPLALSGADDDGGNTVPMHVECHQLKTFGRKRRREGCDVHRIPTTRRTRMSRVDGPPWSCRSLTHPHLVRSPDGSVYLRDGTEQKMR